MKLSRLIIIAAATVAMSALTSCRKDLCYNHFRTAAIDLTWEHEWERDYGHAHAANWDASLHGFGYDELRPVMPEWVSGLAYTDESSPREFFLGLKGGNLPVDGTTGLSFLLYNGDTEYIVLSDIASLAEARATSTSRSRSSLDSLSALFPTMRSSNPPDVLYAAYVDNVPYIDLHEERHLPVKMQPLVYTYVIRYEFEYGIHHVALARGALLGMAESVYLRNGVTSESSTMTLYECDIKDYGCEARVRTFGVPGFPDEYYGRSVMSRSDFPYMLNLEVRLNNGKVLEFNYDIADQIANQPRGGVIRVSGIRIEDDQSLTDSGFDVEVSDWGEYVDIELPVGGDQK